MATSELRNEWIASWNTNAAFWDYSIGRDGNIYWRRLQEPSLGRLLAGLKPGFRALDLCTGNGLCARWLAARGASSVVATDGSSKMLERARARCEGVDNVEFRLINVCDADALEREAGAAAKFGGYDVVLMNMAIMDVPSLDELAAALPRLLNKDGVFVATLLHPVFFTSNAAREVRLDETTGDLEVIRTKVIREYLSVPPVLGIAVPGQPAKQLYFHRPMDELFRPFFGAGLVMDAMEEPAFTEEDRDPNKVEAHRNYTQLPAILSFRMRQGSPKS